MEREVLSRYEKYKDLEIHTSKVTENGNEYVEIREYIPSLDRYGRGITAPGAAALLILEGLEWFYPSDD